MTQNNKTNMLCKNASSWFTMIHIEGLHIYLEKNRPVSKDNYNLHPQAVHV